MVLSTTVEQPDAAIETPAAEDPELRGRVDYLLAEAAARTQATRLPVATYRLQLHGQFTFAAARQIVDYLDALGISDLYASPFLQAAQGSTHGYDIVDHSRVNIEIGSGDDLRSLSASLRERGMGLLMDVVPNHMRASPDANAWWRDVLENGQSSRYAAFFDIDWHPLKPDLLNRVLLPVLEDQYGKVLEDGLLQVEYAEGAFRLTYYERHFPLSPPSWLLILDSQTEELQGLLGAEDPHLLEFLSILTAIRNLPARTETDPERREERHREKEIIKRRLHALTEDSPPVAEFIAHRVQRINGQPGDPRSFDRLDQIIDEQAYRLSYWRTATDEINYRRFFDINELAAICMERPEVFEATHALVFEWIDQGIVTGLRIDHPDGLFDPPAYLRTLQEQRFRQHCRAAAEAAAGRPAHIDADACQWEEAIDRAMELWREATRIPGSELARPLYVAVEKILEHGEHVPQDWTVHGTVGYEFLNRLGGLFVDPKGEKPLSTTYTRFTNESLDFRELEYSCKRLIARMSMASELHVLGYQLDRVSERNRWTRDFTLNSLIEAVQEVISCFSVYRTYVHEEFVLERDRLYIDSAVARAKRRNPAMNASVFDFLRDVLLLKYSDHVDADERKLLHTFVGKFQQLTGPIMAKAVEDTAFYRFNRLASLNEVGGEPARFGNDLDAFHESNLDNLPRLARGLTATTTHDTKRSEDVRARINVLSEAPRQWREQVMRWTRWNRRLKTNVDGEDAPSRNDEYLLYQTLVGVWPGKLPAGPARAEFIERIEQYMLKVAREAKVHTSWINPHEGYEQALLRFVRSILADARRGPFLDELERFAAQAAEHGYWNSLGQLLLKAASPGVPDFFQGTENWTLTLVDPDNRRPVDFERSRRSLEDIARRLAECVDAEGDAVEAWLDVCLSGGRPDDRNPSAEALAADLLANRADGRIKLYATQLLLRMRRRLPDLFTGGGYVPLDADGDAEDLAVAFARVHHDQAALALAPRWTVRLTGFAGPPPIGELWGETALKVPPALRGRTWCDIFTGRRHACTPEGRLPVRNVLGQLPIALLVAAPI